jgi:hypothetical protein
MKKTIAYLFLFFIFILAKSQEDCLIKFSYSGKITRVNKFLDKEVSILLPSTLNLMRYKNDRCYYLEIKINSQEKSYSKDFFSQMSGDFCQDSEWIIKNIFIGDLKKYNVFVVSGIEKIKVKIKVNDISFDFIDNKFNILLPEIKI